MAVPGPTMNFMTLNQPSQGGWSTGHNFGGGGLNWSTGDSANAGGGSHTSPPSPPMNPGTTSATPFRNWTDLPMFNGPYSAGLTGGQLDALTGFNRLFTGQPLMDTRDLLRGINFSAAGGSVFGQNAGKPLEQQVDPFRMPSTATDVATQAAQTGFKTSGPATSDLTGLSDNISQIFGGGSAGQRFNAPRFDTTEMFQTGQQVFQNDMDKALAQIKEEFSGLGLGPGSTDRSERLLGEAANHANRFRLGQLELGRQSFENAENRGLAEMGQRISALPAALAAATTPFQQGMSLAGLNESAAERRMAALPTLGALEELPFQRFTQMGDRGQQRANDMLPFMFALEQLPFNRAEQQFGLNEQARQIADQDLVRRMGEFARTQGGGLNQLLAVLSGVPLNNTLMGPSILSQLSGLVGGAAAAAGAV